MSHPAIVIALPAVNLYQVNLTWMCLSDLSVV